MDICAAQWVCGSCRTYFHNHYGQTTVKVRIVNVLCCRQEVENSLFTTEAGQRLLSFPVCDNFHTSEGLLIHPSNYNIRHFQ